jgi:hypothetical protein
MGSAAIAVTNRQSAGGVGIIYSLMPPASQDYPRTGSEFLD